MALKLTLLEVKSTVKAIGQSRKIKIKRANMFVEPGVYLKGKKLRYCFFVSTGGHGMGGWITKFALNWLSNVAQGAAGAGASGLGALGSGIASASGKASGLAGLSGSFREGVIRDAKSLEDIGGAGNLLHVMKAQNAVGYYGVLDVWGEVSFGLWGGLPDDSGSWNYYLRQLKDNRYADTSYHFTGSFLRGQGVVEVGGQYYKLKK